ncbi:glycine zipper 2TM domain-containing protein [Desulfopila sp. IMCC35008]|uniref:glycine zipper 2TM domain-containing protein n=1 Tax=Desulfopila sp. IMCC35008 TaxID=2653858 RepID=UPI0013D2823F|nr:glycine zipper 2TM domain-containing protein [Desulfopila sp. IMCC35008]
MQILTKFFLITLSLFMFSGCQTTGSGSKTYSRSQAQSPMTVFSGTILKVADVQIQNNQSGVGAVVGGVAGGVAGSTIGSGRGKTLATTAGALAGLAGGAAAEKAMGNKMGVELEVELDNGKIVVVVQEKDDEFAVGDRVRILQGQDGSMRVRQ